jgi:hypothetical protein
MPLICPVPSTSHVLYYPNGFLFNYLIRDVINESWASVLVGELRTWQVSEIVGSS